MDVNALISAAVTGVAVGSMYGLTALGFFITYAVCGCVNFAQGATLMLGAVLLFVFHVKLGLWLPFSIAASLVLCALWSLLVERIAVRPFVVRGSDAWLMATVALGLILENAVLFVFGKDPRGLPASWLTQGGLEVAGIRVVPLQVLIPLAGFGLAYGLRLFLARTRLGRGLAAVAQQREAASLMAINVQRATSLAFGLAGACAAMAGMLIAPLFTISAGMGTVFGIKAFAAAILGGIDNPRGVMAAGLVLGLVESMVIAIAGSSWTQILSFAIVIAALAWRPHGLFGRVALKKV
jgi:branched-chain amino acid transport system permease protein